MAGGLIQVISSGNQDIMLTGNPEITFFNIIYRRYTNFGKKIVELSFDNNINFGETSVLTIPKNSGDLLSRLTLRIKLPKIDISDLSQEILTQNIISNAEDNSVYILYYNYFISFYNNLLNVVNLFFNKYDNINSLTYITDLSTYILSNINTDKYNQFFTVVNYFFNNGLVTNQNNVNTSLYTNASLFKLVNSNLIYIYENWTTNQMSYELFKFTIYKNLDILSNLNVVLYNMIKELVTPDSFIKFAWVDKIGIYLFNSIEFYIGSNKITTMSDYYINNYGDLFYKNPEVYNNIIGANQNINLFTISKDETYLYLPIPLWFNSNYGLAFPLIALQFNSIQLKINLKKFYECIKIDIDSSIKNEKIQNQIIQFIVNNSINMLKTKLDITVLAEYIYLDSIERRKFAQSGHEYLITQVQEIEFDNVTKYNNSFSLDFFHCCKDMYWSIVKNRTIRDIFNSNSNSFNYSYNISPIIENVYNNIFIEYLNILYNNNKMFNAYEFISGLSLFNSNVTTGNYIKFISNYIINDFTKLIDSSHIIESSFLYLNSTVLIGDVSNFYNYLVPYKCYNSSPQKGLYSYSFALHPTETQPSGTINLSRIPSYMLKIKINESIDISKDSNLNYNSVNNLETVKILNNNNSNYKLIVQVNNYNVLRLIGGIGALAYTY
jgi:hypothetical protein